MSISLFQTNILSLNAAIEAARAGEHGKGFLMGLHAEEGDMEAPYSIGTTGSVGMDLEEMVRLYQETVGPNFEVWVSAGGDVVYLSGGWTWLRREMSCDGQVLSPGIWRLYPLVDDDGYGRGTTTLEVSPGGESLPGPRFLGWQKLFHLDVVRYLARLDGYYCAPAGWVEPEWFEVLSHPRALDVYRSREDNQSLDPGSGDPWEISIDTFRNGIRDDVYWRKYAPKKKVWEHFHGRVPESGGLVADMPRESVPEFSFKRFRAELARFMEQGYTRMARDMAIRASFTDVQWRSLAKRMGLNAHDFLVLLPYAPTVGLMRQVKGFVPKSEDLRAVAKQWRNLSLQDRKLRWKDLVAKARSMVYDGVLPAAEALAVEAARFGYSEDDFWDIQERWLESLGGLAREGVPMVDIQVDDWRIYRTEKNDPRNLFLGDYTNCCQHPGGAGGSCAWHGVEDPDGAFFVVERKGKIIAQSWAWRKDDTLVFDNIECVDLEGYQDRIVLLYEYAAEALIGQLGIRKVNVGTGYSDIALPWPLTDAVEILYGVYTDAGVQHCIREV